MTGFSPEYWGEKKKGGAGKEKKALGGELRFRKESGQNKHLEGTHTKKGHFRALG